MLSLVHPSPTRPQCPFLGGASKPSGLYLGQMRNLLAGDAVTRGLRILEGTGLGFPKAPSLGNERTVPGGRLQQVAWQ